MKQLCEQSGTAESSSRQADLEESVEVVIAGYQKKNALLTDKEKLTVAYHEIGHALVAALPDQLRTGDRRLRSFPVPPVHLAIPCR